MAENAAFSVRESLFADDRRAGLSISAFRVDQEKDGFEPNGELRPAASERNYETCEPASLVKHPATAPQDGQGANSGP